MFNSILNFFRGANSEDSEARKVFDEMALVFNSLRERGYPRWTDEEYDAVLDNQEVLARLSSLEFKQRHLASIYEGIYHTDMRSPEHNVYVYVGNEFYSNLGLHTVREQKQFYFEAMYKYPEYFKVPKEQERKRTRGEVLELLSHALSRKKFPSTFIEQVEHTPQFSIGR